MVVADASAHQKLRHGIIQNPVYMVTGYNATTQVITVLNPYADCATYSQDG